MKVIYTKTEILDVLTILLRQFGHIDETNTVFNTSKIYYLYPPNEENLSLVCFEIVKGLPEVRIKSVNILPSNAAEIIVCYNINL